MVGFVGMVCFFENKTKTNTVEPKVKCSVDVVFFAGLNFIIEGIISGFASRIFKSKLFPYLALAEVSCTTCGACILIGNQIACSHNNLMEQNMIVAQVCRLLFSDDNQTIILCSNSECGKEEFELNLNLNWGTHCYIN